MLRSSVDGSLTPTFISGEDTQVTAPGVSATATPLLTLRADSNLLGAVWLLA